MWCHMRQVSRELKSQAHNERLRRHAFVWLKFRHIRNEELELDSREHQAKDIRHELH